MAFHPVQTNPFGPASGPGPPPETEVSGGGVLQRRPINPGQRRLPFFQDKAEERLFQGRENELNRQAQTSALRNQGTQVIGAGGGGGRGGGRASGSATFTPTASGLFADAANPFGGQTVQNRIGARRNLLQATAGSRGGVAGSQTLAPNPFL